MGPVDELIKATKPKKDEEPEEEEDSLVGEIVGKQAAPKPAASRTFSVPALFPNS